MRDIEYKYFIANEGHQEVKWENCYNRKLDLASFFEESSKSQIHVVDYEFSRDVVKPTVH